MTKEFTHSYHLGLLRLVAPHLTPGQNGTLRISDKELRGFIPDPIELHFLPDSVYQGFDDSGHVFMKSGIDRLLGAGWKCKERTVG